MSLAKTLSKLISFRTLSRDQKEVRKLYAWTEKELRVFPLHFKREKSRGFESLIITTRKTKTPRLFLVAHIDVVPASSELFKARTKGRKMCGRGAFDMKFGAACFIELFKELGPNLTRFDLGMMLTSDEEIGGTNGAKYLAKKGYSADAMFLPDSGDELALEQAAKGAWHFKLVSKGKGGHGSMPWLGENAIERLIEFLHRLREKIEGPCGGACDHWHVTMNVGKISGGIVANQIPESAEALVDIRFTVPEEWKRITGVVEKLLGEFPKIDLETVAEGPSYSTDLGHPYIRRFTDIVRERKGLLPEPVVSHGMTDARFFAEKGIPVVITRPKGGDIHSDKEWIDLPSLDEFYVLLREFATAVAKR